MMKKIKLYNDTTVNVMLPIGTSTYEGCHLEVALWHLGSYNRKSESFRITNFTVQDVNVYSCKILAAVHKQSWLGEWGVAVLMKDENGNQPWCVVKPKYFEYVLPTGSDSSSILDIEVSSSD